MHRQVKLCLVQLTIVFGLTMLMSAWKQEFILDGIKSNIMLNGIIIGTFAFGIILIYFAAFKLKNEYTAFGALKQDYSDRETERKNNENETDPMWKYYRCKEDAVVFKRPNLLRQPYLIISEEIARGKDLTLTPDVVSTLVDNIDARIGDQQSLINYVTGITVMLGLIGTFVGLLITLASIGAIIGGIDLSGGDIMVTVQKLLDNLQVPLNGMATGFSSSLFGLVSSLVLGIMARFFSLSTGQLSVDFEGWLVSISKIDGYEDDAAEAELSAGGVGGKGGGAGYASTGAVSLMEGKYLELMMRVARYNVISQSKTNARMDQLTKTVDAILEKTKTDAGILSDITSTLGTMNNNMHKTSHVLETTLSALDEKNKALSDIRELHQSYHTLSEKTQNTATALDQSIDQLTKSVLTAVDIAAKSSAHQAGEMLEARFEKEMKTSVADRLYSKIYFDFKELGYALENVKQPVHESGELKQALNQSIAEKLWSRIQAKKPNKQGEALHSGEKDLDVLSKTLSDQLKKVAETAKPAPSAPPQSAPPQSEQKMQVNARVTLGEWNQTTKSGTTQTQVGNSDKDERGE